MVSRSEESPISPIWMVPCRLLNDKSTVFNFWLFANVPFLTCFLQMESIYWGDYAGQNRKQYILFLFEGFKIERRFAKYVTYYRIFVQQTLEILFCESSTTSNKLLLLNTSSGMLSIKFPDAKNLSMCKFSSNSIWGRESILFCIMLTLCKRSDVLLVITNAVKLGPKSCL